MWRVKARSILVAMHMDGIGVSRPCDCSSTNSPIAFMTNAMVYGGSRF